MKAVFTLPEVEVLSEKVDQLTEHVRSLTIANASLLDKINVLLKFESKKYSIKEVASIFNKKYPQQVYKLFDQGLKYEYFGGHRYVYATSINEFIAKSNKYLKIKQKLIQN